MKTKFIFFLLALIQVIDIQSAAVSSLKEIAAKALVQDVQQSMPDFYNALKKGVPASRAFDVFNQRFPSQLLRQALFDSHKHNILNLTLGYPILTLDQPDITFFKYNNDGSQFILNYATPDDNHAIKIFATQILMKDGRYQKILEKNLTNDEGLDETFLDVTSNDSILYVTGQRLVEVNAFSGQIMKDFRILSENEEYTESLLIDRKPHDFDLVAFIIKDQDQRPFVRLINKETGETVREFRYAQGSDPCSLTYNNQINTLFVQLGDKLQAIDLNTFEDKIITPFATDQQGNEQRIGFWESKGNYLFIVSSNLSDLIIWNVRENRRMETPQNLLLPVTMHGAQRIEASQNGSLLAFAGNTTEGNIFLYDFTLKELFSLKGHESQIEQIEFTQDGNYLISTSFDKTLRVWDIAKSNLRDAQDKLINPIVTIGKHAIDADESLVIQPQNENRPFYIFTCMAHGGDANRVRFWFLPKETFFTFNELIYLITITQLNKISFENVEEFNRFVDALNDTSVLNDLPNPVKKIIMQVLNREIGKARKKIVESNNE